MPEQTPDPAPIETDSVPVKMASEPVVPIPVAVIDTKPTASVGSPLTTGTVAVTPDHQPNLVVTMVTPFVAVLVRFLNHYFTTLVGLITAGLTPEGGKLIHASDFFHLVLVCAALSIPGAGLSALKDIVTILNNWEGKFPLLTGSV